MLKWINISPERTLSNNDNQTLKPSTRKKRQKERKKILIYAKKSVLLKREINKLQTIKTAIIVL